MAMGAGGRSPKITLAWISQIKLIALSIGCSGMHALGCLKTIKGFPDFVNRYAISSIASLSSSRRLTLCGAGLEFVVIPVYHHHRLPSSQMIPADPSSIPASVSLVTSTPASPEPDIIRWYPAPGWATGHAFAEAQPSL